MKNVLQTAEDNIRRGVTAAAMAKTAAAAREAHGDACVGVLRKELLKQLKESYAAVTKAWEVFKTVQILNTKLVRMVMKQLNVKSQ